MKNLRRGHRMASAAEDEIAAKVARDVQPLGAIIAPDA